jgi:hypothetical protein
MFEIVDRVSDHNTSKKSVPARSGIGCKIFECGLHHLDEVPLKIFHSILIALFARTRGNRFANTVPTRGFFEIRLIKLSV